MNSEKVKEIKKALECCKKSLCIDCPYDLSDCEMGLRYDMEDYINELESENERLNNTEIGELIKENEELEKQCVAWSELDFKKRNKIKELKDRIAELEKRCHFIWALGYDYDGCEKSDSLKTLIDELVGIAQGNWGDVCSKYENKQENLINAKLKQFAERLIEKAKKESYIDKRSHANLTDFIIDIDETLKEFINGNKCVICGVGKPEGKQVCENCEKEIKK